MSYRLRPGLVDYPSKNSAILAHQRRLLASYIIGDELAADGHSIVINPGSVYIREKLIFFDTEVRQVVSEAIYGRTFPRLQAGEYFHNTGIPALRGIAERGELRLHWLRKRMEHAVEGELINLARIEGWTGLLAENWDPQDPEPPGSNLFYISMVDVEGGTGLWSFGSVRLRLRVNAAGKMGQLREIRYHSGDDVTLLGKVNRALASEGLPPILPEGSYRMAAHSLPKSFAPETEVRLLYMHFEGLPDLRQQDGDVVYWPVPIGGESDVAEIELIGLEVNSKRALNQVRKALTGTVFEAIEPTLVMLDTPR